MNTSDKLTRIITVAALLAAQVGVGGARAGDENGNLDVKALLKRIEDLEQKVKALEGKLSPDAVVELEHKMRILERKSEPAQQAAAEKARTAPTISIGENGLQARSADTNFAMALHGVLQVDNRTFFSDRNLQGNEIGR